MSVHCIVEEKIRLKDQTRERYLPTPLQYSNAYAHAMRVVVIDDNGDPANLSSVGVTGWFKRSDNESVGPISGTITGNVAEVLLPPQCYAYAGAYTFTLDLSEGDAIRTALKVRGFVDRNVTDAIVDPGTPVGNIEQAISNANAAASAATTAATQATTAAAAAQEVADTVEGDVSDLKSAMTAAQSDISGVQSDMNTANSEINTISNRVSTIEKHFTSVSGFKVGTSTTATGVNAVAEGNMTTVSGKNAHAEGDGSAASNENAHAEGNGSVASGKNAHAEGGWNVGMTDDPGKRYSTASGTSSHSEGSGCHAEGTGSHAEGVATTATGEGAHAEGRVTTARGTGSHAEGFNTIAYYNYQHVFGQFNATENGAEIVGKGTDADNRKNIRVLDWSGNEKLAGSLTLGMGTTDEVTITAAQLKQLLALLNT